MKTCTSCGSQVRIENEVCPNCKVGTHFTSRQVHAWGFDTSGTSAAEKSAEIQKSLEEGVGLQPKSAENFDMKQLENLIKTVTVAQNRTTHSIRAFVRFLFIQLSATTLAGIFWVISSANVDQYACLTEGKNCSANTPLQVLSAAIWIAGVFLSSRAGWDELEKSRI